VLLVLSVLLLGAVSLIALVVLRRQGDLPPMCPTSARIAVSALLGLVVAALWWIPRWQARAMGADTPARERGELIDRYRRTLAGILGGALLVLVCANAVRVAGMVQAVAVNDRFLAAADRLDSERLSTRLAAIYVMESLANAEASVRRPVLEALLAFVQRRTQEAAGVDSLPPSPDLVAAVTVLSRRTDDGGRPPFQPDFSGANLRGASLAGAQWDFGVFRGTRLEGADLRGARIAGKGARICAASGLTAPTWSGRTSTGRGSRTGRCSRMPTCEARISTGLDHPATARFPAPRVAVNC
jgi:hypothetical protein